MSKRVEETIDSRDQEAPNIQNQAKPIQYFVFHDDLMPQLAEIHIGENFLDTVEKNTLNPDDLPKFVEEGKESDSVKVDTASNKLAIERTMPMEGDEKNQTIEDLATPELTARGTQRKIRLHKDLPHPDLPASAEINRVKKLMSVRLDEEIISNITAFAKAVKKDRQVCVQEAIIQYLDQAELKYHT